MDVNESEEVANQFGKWMAKGANSLLLTQFKLIEQEMEKVKDWRDEIEIIDTTIKNILDVWGSTFRISIEGTGFTVLGETRGSVLEFLREDKRLLENKIKAAIIDIQKVSSEL